ncbi:MAG: hypothetical protein ACTSR2_06370 [Candidatus Hodarchaeales archaeon]
MKRKLDFDIEFKPRRVATNNPWAFRKIDNDTVNVPLPSHIAGKRMRVFRGKHYRTVHCMICGMPTVWFDRRIKHQFNKCQHCDAIHEMLLDNWGHVKKRVVEFFPENYLDKRPFILR